MDIIIDSLQPAKSHRTSKQLGRAVARALDATFVPGVAFTGSLKNVATTPPGSVQTTVPSLPLSSYDSIYASVNNNYSPGQVPATLTTPGYQGPTADAQVTAASSGDNSVSNGTSSKPLLSGTTLWAVIAGGAALVLIIIIILAVWCWKRKKVKKAEENWYRGKDDSGSRLVSEKPSTIGHSSDGKLSEQEKHWGSSPTSSIPGKNENGEELDHNSGRDELLGLVGARKGSRQGYQNNSSYQDTPRSDGQKGSPESTAESSTLAGSPPRKNSNYLPDLPKDQAFVPASRLRYGSIDEMKEKYTEHSYTDYSRPSQYQQQTPARQSRFEESGGGNYTDFMVRSTARSSISSEGRISPLQHEKVSNRKKSIGGRKTDTILDFTDAYSYGNNDEMEQEAIDHDGSTWGESKRKRNLSLTNPFVPLPLLLATSASSDSFPPSPRTKSTSKSLPPRRVESQNDPRYGRIDSQPLHELESIIDSFGYKPRRDSRSTASSTGSPSLRALSLVPKVVPVVRPPPVIVTAPSFAVSHPTSFNPGFGRSPISAISITPEVPSPIPLPVPLPNRQNSKPLPPSTVLPMGRGISNRIQPPPPPITIPIAVVPPTTYSRSRMNSNTSSSSTSSRSQINYSGSSRSNPSPNSDKSYPTYTQNSSNNVVAGHQPIATVRSDWETSSSSTSRSMSDTRPSQESLSAMRSRPNPERKGSYGGGSGIGGQGLGGGPIRPQGGSQDRTTILQTRPSQDRIQYAPPTRMEPVRSVSRPIYNHLASVPESSSIRRTPPPAPPAIQGRQAVSRNQVLLSPNQRASMLPPLEGEGAGHRYRSATMSIYGMYDE